jgi:hypothetical protein
MAHSLSFTDGGNITPEDVEKWTEKLSHVLDTSPEGHKFRIYLELKQFNTFLLKTKKQRQHTTGAKIFEVKTW